MRASTAVEFLFPYEDAPEAIAATLAGARLNRRCSTCRRAIGPPESAALRRLPDAGDEFAASSRRR